MTFHRVYITSLHHTAPPIIDTVADLIEHFLSKIFGITPEFAQLLSQLALGLLVSRNCRLFLGALLPNLCLPVSVTSSNGFLHLFLQFPDFCFMLDLQLSELGEHFGTGVC